MGDCLDRNGEPIKADDTVWHSMGHWGVKNVIQDNSIGSIFGQNCCGTKKKMRVKLEDPSDNQLKTVNCDDVRFVHRGRSTAAARESTARKTTARRTTARRTTARESSGRGRLPKVKRRKSNRHKSKKRKSKKRRSKTRRR